MLLIPRNDWTVRHAGASGGMPAKDSHWIQSSTGKQQAKRTQQRLVVRGPEICTLFKLTMWTQSKRAILHLKRANTPKVIFACFIPTRVQNSPLLQAPLSCHAGYPDAVNGLRFFESIN